MYRDFIQALPISRGGLASGRRLALLIVGMMLIACASAQEPADVLAAVPAPADAADGEVVVAYYCHVTFRCETCLTAERLLEDLLRTDFADALEEKRLFWQPLDYEQPENAAYAEAFGLESGPAFVLGRWRDGRLVEWHEVLEIWDHSEDSSALIKVARDRLKLFLQTEKWGAAMDSTRVANGAPAVSATAEPPAPVNVAPRVPANAAEGAATETPKAGEAK